MEGGIIHLTNFKKFNRLRINIEISEIDNIQITTFKFLVDLKN